MKQYREVSRVIDASFGMRRKTLRNNLRTRFDTTVIEAALTASQLDGGVRAEMLDSNSFVALTNALAKGMCA
jgi:16S rRNA A1518/A1519 N6-dimethyltransferase RsmA/KsgA/DIM1 with predicted DNA glycosylase/AP lyase activity